MLMQIVIQGHELLLNPLTPEMNEAFIHLYSAYLGHSTYTWEQFEIAAYKFFDKVDRTEHDKFFENFTHRWRGWLHSGQFDSAEQLWSQAISTALNWENMHACQKVHKGTPFYFWGMTAILRGDLDRGYALMHQAVEEDVRTSGTKFPDTPAYALVTLNSQKVDQAFRGWVLQKADFLANLLTQYRDTNKYTLTLDGFQKRFLLNPPNREAAFLLAYAIARFMKLHNVPSYALQSEFISQLELNLLFDIALVIDAAIKTHNSGQWKFIDHATFLANQAHLGLSKNDLGAINDGFKTVFDTTLITLLDGNYALSGRHILNLSRDLAIAYGIRNFGAHHISSVRDVGRRFSDLQQAVFNTLFLTVETLY